MPSTLDRGCDSPAELVHAARHVDAVGAGRAVCRRRGVRGAVATLVGGTGRACSPPPAMGAAEPLIELDEVGASESSSERTTSKALQQFGGEAGDVAALARGERDVAEAGLAAEGVGEHARALFDSPRYGASIWLVSPVNTTLVPSPTRVRIVRSVVGSRFWASSITTIWRCSERPRRNVTDSSESFPRAVSSSIIRRASALRCDR